MAVLAAAVQALVQALTSHINPATIAATGAIGAAAYLKQSPLPR